VSRRSEPAWPEVLVRLVKYVVTEAVKLNPKNKTLLESAGRELVAEIQRRKR